MIKTIINDFNSWVYSYSEEIFGIPLGFVIVDRFQLRNELIHTIFTIFSALVSAYLVHLLKKKKFHLEFKTFIKNIFKR